MSIVDEINKTRESLLNAPPAPPVDEAKKVKKSQATQILELIEMDAHSFFNSNEEGFVTIPKEDHVECWPIKSSGYRQILTNLFWLKKQNGCNKNSLAEAIATVEARALFQSTKEKVYMRVAAPPGENKLFVDLCDNAWRVVEITPEGWKILNKSPVKFIRKSGMEALPAPEKGMEIQEIKRFINVCDEQLILIISWILGCFRGKAAYPVLILQGRQGSGKSTASRILRLLVDPNRVPLRAPPREPRDLVISAINSHLLALDNLSGMDHHLADAICRFSTGAGFDPRALFTDLEQILVQVERPVLINGIDDLATRPDLDERSIIITLPTIEKRIDETSLWANFHAARPKLLGAIFSSLSAALKNEAETRERLKQQNRLPRMADFAVWVSAAENEIGWKQDHFLNIYLASQLKSSAENLDANAVVTALLSHLANFDENTPWTGEADDWKKLLLSWQFALKKPDHLSKHPWQISPTNLYETLTARAGKKGFSKAWPQSTRGLKNALNRAAVDLAKFGVQFDSERTGSQRFYKFEMNLEKAIDTLAPLFPQVENWFN